MKMDVVVKSRTQTQISFKFRTKFVGLLWLRMVVFVVVVAIVVVVEAVVVAVAVKIVVECVAAGGCGGNWFL